MKSKIFMLGLTTIVGVIVVQSHQVAIPYDNSNPNKLDNLGTSTQVDNQNQFSKWLTGGLIATGIVGTVSLAMIATKPKQVKKQKNQHDRERQVNPTENKFKINESKNKAENNELFTSTGVLYPTLEELFQATLSAENLRIPHRNAIYENLDEEQIKFSLRSREIMNQALNKLSYVCYEQPFNILQKERLYSVAENCFEDALIEANMSYVKPYLENIYFCLIDDVVEECKHKRLRNELKKNREKLDEEQKKAPADLEYLIKRITELEVLVKPFDKQNNNENEIYSLAEKELNDESFRIYQSVISDIYNRIPYSYYGIYQAIKFREKGGINRTEAEENYLAQYLKYHNAAYHEIRQEKNAEYN